MKVNWKFDDKGLIPAVIQDYKTREVLMVAFMNKASLKETLKKERPVSGSRSRKKLWVKGETSGHFQFVKSIYYDCDCDWPIDKSQANRPGVPHGKQKLFL